MTATFLGLIALSIAIALFSRRGHHHQRAEDFFVASGQFGAVLFFFLAVGETYSVATILGFPGGVYARGTGFVSWFLGYILLSFPVGYFLNPWIWRAGRLHGAITLPDLFRRHFNSRPLEIVVTVASLLFLIPLGTMQFVGLDRILLGLGWSMPPIILTAFAGMLAFGYIAISGIRAPAFVAVLKDLLMLAAILCTAIAALSAYGHTPATLAATGHRVIPASVGGDLFSMSTILLQSIGFCMVPQTCAYVFTARSVKTLRRAQVVMPLYMVMFPFLIVISYFALSQKLNIQSPDDVFLATARLLLPSWAVGLVMAGAALSALVVLTGICLALGPLVTRNLMPGLSGDQQRRWSKLVMALYLILSIAGAAHSSQLMVATNNLFYFGITQSFPGVMAILFLRSVRAPAIMAGLIVGDIAALVLHFLDGSSTGLNPGFVGLLVNMMIVIILAWLWPGAEVTPIAMRLTQAATPPRSRSTCEPP